jgi:hypothetical protein
VTISGSGFEPATAVTVGGAPVSTTFVDANTLRVTIPSLNSGTAQISISNASGDSYSLDNAFVVQ